MGSYKGRVFAAMSLLAALVAAPQIRAVPLEVYGRLPAIEDVALSPDGSRIAYIRTSGDVRALVVISLADKKLIGGVRSGTTKLRQIRWADDDHLLLLTSTNTPPQSFAGVLNEWFTMEVYDVAKRAATPLVNPFINGVPLSNLISGRYMVRHVSGHTIVFVSVLSITQQTLPVLLRVDLQTGTQTIVKYGSPSTLAWLVDEAGELALEEDYDQQNRRWALLQRSGASLHEIASGHVDIDYPAIVGFGPDADTVIMEMIENGDPVWRSLSTKDGTFGSPMAEGRIMALPIEDQTTYRMIGGLHESEDSSRYIFFDRKTQASWDAIARAFNKDRVTLASTSRDFKKVVVQVDGQEFGYIYELIDMNTLKGEPIGDVYEGVDPLEVQRITYEAADGLKITAYVTLPPKKVLKNLPLVVFPHGGPAARDSAHFDWWAQAMAAQGYAVLQPNFRGSAVNMRLLSAGFGEWGRKMQTDLSDGVRYLVKQGMVDPARVCIVGASYGGYAALAGVTLDPGVYRCAVSVAGPSDLKRMLGRPNSDSLSQRYWDRYMGVTGPSDAKLQEISPIKHIDAVTVPVLLIHGRNDIVVPFEQSDVMYDALKHAKKDVELVTLKDEDHWLSRSETRLQMLQASVAFLRAHNPPD
jgi:dipeptidyl aminopeptidase/acylaminoacyl peptidase